ncbi:GNAT family N-acetyltransferase [Candidatus Sumerlaeota bacterium]|nr:GNAT family N-acetyltransferase [Candidatus Sumerlaeota bacterium]
MKFTCAKTGKDLEEIADMMGKIFRRKNWFEFYQMRMAYQTKAPYYKPEHSRIVREKGKILGHVSIIEKYMRIEDCIVKIAGIGDVYTHPDARGKHVASHLMNDAIDYMRKRRYPLTMLYGIPNFYHKFGYIEAMMDSKIFLPVKHAVKVVSELTLRPCAESDVPALNKIYNNHFRMKTGSIRRAPASWYNIANPKELFVVADSRNRPLGYVILRTGGAGDLYAAEVVAPTEQIRKSALAFYVQKAKESFMPELEFHIAPDDPYAFFLQDFGARFVSRYFAEGEGSAMLGLINLPLFLNRIKPVLERRLASSEKLQKIKGLNFITDSAGKAALIFRKGNVAVTGITKGLETMETPQTYLTRSLIGHWDSERFISRVRESGGFIPEKLESVLGDLFPVQFPYTNEPDYF